MGQKEQKETAVTGKNRIMIYVRRMTTRTSSICESQTVRRWRSACPLERPACSSISRSECRTASSYRTFREVKKAPASLYRGFKWWEAEQRT
jgi:Tfp pilus assembly protein PilV